MKILYITANAEWVEKKAAPSAGNRTAAMKLWAEIKALLARYPKLELWPELQSFVDTLFAARANGSVQVEVVPEARRSDVALRIDRFRPNIVHFNGLADSMESATEEDEDPPHAVTASADWLRGVLTDKGVDVLLLNDYWPTCLAPDLQDVVGVSIGPGKKLKSDTAAQFTETFYSALDAGLTVRKAFEAAAGDADDYVANPSTDSSDSTKVWESPTQPRQEPSIFDQYQTRLDQMMSRIPATIGADFLRTFAGGVIAYAAFLILDGSLLEWLGKCSTQHVPVIGGWAPGIKEFLEAYLAGEKSSSEYLKKESWLALEPFAIFLVLTRNSLGRIAGWLTSILGTGGPDQVIEVARLSEAMAEKHLVSERLALMFTWLKEYDKDE